MTEARISVIVPAFNEAGSLESTVKHILGAIDDPTSAELVLVDDGSTDETHLLMQRLAETCPARVVIVHRPKNGGMGAALASGFEQASGKVLTWIPGDGEYDLEEVLGGLSMLDDNEIVLIQRTARGQLGRNLMSSAMYLLIRVLFGFNATGYCGIFIVKRSTWDTVAITSRDVFFTLEVAIRARQAGWRTALHQAEWRPRREGRSKVFNLSTIIRNVGELFAFRWRLWRHR